MQINDVSIQDLISFGLRYEKARAESASYKISVSNVAISSSDLKNIKEYSSKEYFLNSIIGQNSAISNKFETKKVYEPNHPLADSKGMVVYPKIDTATEMATLISANRAYEANIRIFNTIKDMTAKAYEIGK